MTQRVIIGTICQTILLVSQSTLFAQVQLSPTPRYQPQRPTTSPYLNLLRPNTGTLPNYHVFVRPAFDQAAFNTRQDTGFRRLSTSLQILERAPVLRETTVRSTGTLTGMVRGQRPFQRYSHYYPRRIE